LRSTPTTVQSQVVQEIGDYCLKDCTICVLVDINNQAENGFCKLNGC
jgi:hypothetical protein